MYRGSKKKHLIQHYNNEKQFYLLIIKERLYGGAWRKESE